MDTKQIKQKGLSNNNISSVEADLELINKHTIKPLTADEVYTFKVIICDNDVDRVGDKMSIDFLHQVADNITGVTGLKDHDWSADKQLSRLYDAEVVVDDSVKTKLGEPRVYVLGKAYTLSKYKDYIDSINAGLLKETSISFESEGDTCSICGEPMVKNINDVAECSNGHIAGHSYDDKLCYNNINKLKDIMEWSLVAVPCQRGAGIKNKNISIGGNGIMKKVEYLIRQFMSSKAYKGAEPEDKAVLEDAVNTDKELELTDEDIKALVEENSKLKAKVKTLEDKVKAAEDGRNRDKIDAIVDKALDSAGLITPDIKELLKKELPWDTLKLEGDCVAGLDDALAGFKSKYKGLFTEEDTNTKGEEPEDTVEDKGEEPEDDTVNKGEEPEANSKALKRPAGIQFGVNSKSVNKTPKSKIKPGIYFN